VRKRSCCRGLKLLRALRRHSARLREARGPLAHPARPPAGSPGV